MNPEAPPPPWRSASAPPEAALGRLHFSIPALGLIYEPAMHDSPHVDIVNFWPASGLWTVTYASRTCEEATDHPVRVLAWQPLPAVPTEWSGLWV